MLLLQGGFLKFFLENNAKDMSVMSDITNRVMVYLAGQGYDEPAIDKVILCLDELISNIHKYGYLTSPDNKPFQLSINPDDNNHFTLTLSDDSHQFDPFLIDYAGEPEDDIENWQIGRLGMKLVKSMSNSHEYKRESNKNLVILQFSRE